MNRPRTLAAIVDAPTHSRPDGEPCFVATETSLHTVKLEEGHFASIAMAHQGPGGRVAILAIMDRAEVDEHVRYLLNSMEDAERADVGLDMIHAGADPTAPRPVADILPGHWDTEEGGQMAKRYVQKDRASLCKGELSDFALANGQYMASCDGMDSIVWQTAAKDRIRWLSVQLALALQGRRG